jgi:hypothetical protein
MYRVSTTAERSFTKNEAGEITEPSERIHAAMETLQHDAPRATKRLLSTFNFDGLFPFASQSNITRALYGVAIDNGFLPPECRLTLRLHKRDPIDMYMERPEIEDDAYHDPSSAIAKQTKIVFTMFELYLVYQSAVMETAAKAGHYKRGGKYYVDIPRLRFENVAGGMSHTVNEITIPAGCMVVLIFWVVEEQLFFNPGRHKNLSNRYTFLPHCINIRLRMKGVNDNTLIFEDGLTNPGTTDSFSSGSCRSYYKWLIGKKLYSRGFESLFPRAGGSYDQILVVSMSPYDMKKDRQLSVEMRYDSASSPSKHRMVYVTIQQGCYSYHDGQPLKLEYLR